MAKANKPAPKPADAAEAAQVEAPKAGQKFSVVDKEFVYILPKFRIPGIGERTSLEAATDDTKYEELDGKTINEFLVSVKAGVIEEA
jgi:hypothetical protein